MGFLTSCHEDAEVHPFSIDKVWEEMVVDFSIEVLDSSAGRVMLIDHCIGVDQLEWKGVSKNSWINIPDSYPGDTILLKVEQSGVYVIELVAIAKGISDMDEPETISSFKKSTIKQFELSNTFVEVQILTPYLSYVKLNGYPSLDKYALPWDADSSGADVVISLNYLYDDEYIEDPLVDTVYQDLSKSQLPITEVATTNFSVEGLSFSVEIEDLDTKRENRYLKERMIWETFIIASLEIPSTAGTIEYDNNYVSIGIEWR